MSVDVGGGGGLKGGTENVRSFSTFFCLMASLFVFRCSMLDIAPDYAGIVFGISNTVRRNLERFIQIMTRIILSFK